MLTLTIKDLDFCKTLDNKAMVSLMGGAATTTIASVKDIKSKTYLGTKPNADGYMAKFYNVVYRTIDVTETISDATTISEVI